MLTVVHDSDAANADEGGAGRSLLDEIVRDGARQMSPDVSAWRKWDSAMRMRSG
jgi:hypothetical protein